MPEEVWQFCRKRYPWAKDQWPNLSDPITTIRTLQDLGLLENISIETLTDAIAQKIGESSPIFQRMHNKVG